MKTATAILLSLLVFTNCASNDQATENIPKASSTKTKAAKKEKANSANATAFKLDFFTSIPGDIDGCGEFFTYDTCTVDDQHYIFLSDLDDMAIIRINGKDVQLKKSKTQSKVINDHISVDVYNGGGYKVTLRKKEEKMVDELYEYTGTLKVTGRKIKVTYKVHGEGGC